MCGKRGESVQDILSECEKLAQKECKRRHDNAAKKIHWELSKKNALGHKEKWYEHSPEGVAENNNNNNNNNNKCPGYDIKLHPVVEFRRGRMRLPFATTTSRSPLSKV